MSPRHYEGKDIQDGQLYIACNSWTTCKIKSHETGGFFVVTLTGMGGVKEYYLSADTIAIMLGDDTLWKLVNPGRQETALPVPTCKHLNIREDRFFSAMIYKTCKDCGQSLN